MTTRQRGARAGDPCPAGRHPLPAGWFPSQGCRGCLNDQALTDAADALIALLPDGTDKQARQALLAVTAGGSTSWHARRYRLITSYLAEHPDGLRSGVSTTPVDVARLITELRRLGRDDVADPRCADCSRPCSPRHHRPDGLRICVNCDGRRRYVACGRCRNVRPVCVRLPDGTPLCQPGHQADPANWEPCGRCGSNGAIRITLRGIRIADCCYLKPHERCSVCGLGRAVSVYASGTATCTACWHGSPTSMPTSPRSPPAGATSTASWPGHLAPGAATS